MPDRGAPSTTIWTGPSRVKRSIVPPSRSHRARIANVSIRAATLISHEPRRISPKPIRRTHDGSPDEEPRRDHPRRDEADHGTDEGRSVAGSPPGAPGAGPP